MWEFNNSFWLCQHLEAHRSMRGNSDSLAVYEDVLFSYMNGGEL